MRVNVEKVIDRDQKISQLDDRAGELGGLFFFFQLQEKIVGERKTKYDILKDAPRQFKLSHFLFLILIYRICV